MYHNLLLVSIDNGIFLLPIRFFDSDYKESMGVVCGDLFDDPNRHVHSIHAHMITI